MKKQDKYHLGLKLLAAAAVVGTLAVGFALAVKSGRTVEVGKLQVVAGENFWGDIAGQIGGDRVQVTSILSDPSADPHLYESDARAASAVAGARLVIVNGLGYDDFMTKLLAADAGGDREVLTAAAVVGVSGADANPHLWYSPDYAAAVALEIEVRLAAADPTGAAVYAANRQKFDASLDAVRGVLAQIKARYPAAAVAYTEPVPAYLLAAAGLTVKTPASFARAIEDGNDPSPADALAMDRLMTTRAVKVLLYNSQATSAVTQHVQDLARQSGVPVVGVSETMPAGVNYQTWQLNQATAILNALGGSGV